jgi:hypothetical protein
VHRAASKRQGHQHQLHTVPLFDMSDGSLL